MNDEPLMDTRMYKYPEEVIRRRITQSEYPALIRGSICRTRYNCQHMRGGEDAWLKCRSGLIWPVTLEYQDSWHSSFQLVG